MFATYDILAYWVWAVLEGRGIHVPNQMSIVGFDWRAHWDKDLADELDTAAQDFEGFGRHAVDLLLNRVSGDAPSAARHVLLEAPLVIRSSTASAPTKQLDPANASS
jgi:DNA-binding LacI/PurR family transcriptional regulator